jgi:hypothetical protein
VNIIEHGTWSSYRPDPHPEGFPDNAMFCKSDLSGSDWYRFRSDPLSLQEGTVKLLLSNESGKWIVVVADRDSSRLFPQARRLIEVQDSDTGDMKGKYVGKLYAEDVRAFTDPIAPDIIPRIASKLGLKRALSEIGLWEAVKSAIASDPQIEEEWGLAVEIIRTDPLTQHIIARLALSNEQVDSLILRAKALVG